MIASTERSPFAGTFNTIQTLTTKVSNKIQTTIKNQTYLPESVRNVSQVAIDHFAETLIVASICSNTLIIPTLVLWSARTVWVRMPFFQELMKKDTNELRESVKESLTSIQSLREQFYPGIAVCAAVAAVFQMVIGWYTRTLIVSAVKSAFFLIVAHLAASAVIVKQETEAASTGTATPDTAPKEGQPPNQTEQLNGAAPAPIVS
jgi:hypothetical protein